MQNLFKKVTIMINGVDPEIGVARNTRLKTVKLPCSDKETIVQEVLLLINNQQEYKKMSKAHNPYGDGKAAERIVQVFKD